MLRPGTAFRRIRAISAFSDIGMANANIDEKQIRSVLNCSPSRATSLLGSFIYRAPAWAPSPCVRCKPAGQGRSARLVHAIKLPGSPKSNLSERTTFYYQDLEIQIRLCPR